MIYVDREDIRDCDEFNIPVNLLIAEIEATEVPDSIRGKRKIWGLSADNLYDHCIDEGHYLVLSDNIGELRKIIREFVLPLYENGFKSISRMANDAEVYFSWSNIDTESLE